MSTHPEVLWAQRSHPHASEKVRHLFLLHVPPHPDSVECHLLDDQPSRYRRAVPRV